MAHLGNDDEPPSAWTAPVAVGPLREPVDEPGLGVAVDVREVSMAEAEAAEAEAADADEAEAAEAELMEAKTELANVVSAYRVSELGKPGRERAVLTDSSEGCLRNVRVRY